MAGLFSAINGAAAGLRTVQTNLKLVSDNVARAEDPTRSRHTLRVQSDPNGSVIGVDFDRRTDAALLAQFNLALARDGGAATRDEYLTRIGEALGSETGSPPLATAMEDFAEAWRSLQTTPESDTAKAQVLTMGERVARELTYASRAVSQLEVDIRSELDQSIDEVNRHLADIERLNIDIVSQGGEGPIANQLRDERDGVIRELSQYIDIRTVDRTDGGVAVFTNNGLAMVDAKAVSFRRGSNDDVVLEGVNEVVVNDQFTDGKIKALRDLIENGATRMPPQVASAEPGTEVIRKLASQLDAIAEALTGTTKTGEPTSFADAYNAAQPVETGELLSSFFVGSDRFTLAVHPDLLDGSQTLKQSAIDAVADAANSAGRTLSADGLTVSDVSYAGMVSAVAGQWSYAGELIADDASQLGEVKQLLEERYHARVGINLDEEIAHLQTLQTAYQASSQVINVANRMFDALERLVG